MLTTIPSILETAAEINPMSIATDTIKKIATGPAARMIPNAIIPRTLNVTIPRIPNVTNPRTPNVTIPRTPNAVIPRIPNAIIPRTPNVAATTTILVAGVATKQKEKRRKNKEFTERKITQDVMKRQTPGTKTMKKGERLLLKGTWTRTTRESSLFQTRRTTVVELIATIVLMIGAETGTITIAIINMKRISNTRKTKTAATENATAIKATAIPATGTTENTTTAYKTRIATILITNRIGGKRTISTQAYSIHFPCPFLRF